MKPIFQPFSHEYDTRRPFSRFRIQPFPWNVYMPLLVIRCLVASFVAWTVFADLGYSQTTEPTDADKILSLRKLIESDKQELFKIKSDLSNPNNDYNITEKMLNLIKSQIQEKTIERRKLSDANQTKEVKRIDRELADLEKSRLLVEKQYSLSLQTRGILEKTANQLELKIAQNQKAINQLLNISEPSTKDPVQPKSIDPPAKKKANVDKKANDATDPKPIDPVLRKAIEDAKAKRLAAQQALDHAESLTDRLHALREFIVGDKKLLRLHQKKIENAQKLLVDLENDLQTKLADKKVKNDEIAPVRQRIFEVKVLLQQAENDKNTVSKRIHQNETDLINLQSDQIRLLQKAEETRREAETAEKKVVELRNPFTPKNLAQWGIDHGPKLILIIIIMWILNRSCRMFSHRAVRLMMRKQVRETERERANRADTLGSVLASAASIAILIGGLLIILDEVGIPIVPLLGGAAILGLAVAFGAQNLFKDYFTGFMILMEDQYGINDIIKISGIRGTVERITLRMTVIRDIEGVLHFFPHGNISLVSNYTHTWSRALFEIGVAYKEDVNRVIDVLMQLANEMREDPDYKSKILDNPRMLGVDRFDDSAVVIKFYMKTAPVQRWRVKWELNRRIKNKFDELGIEIPFPHRTVYHRQMAAKSTNNDHPDKRGQPEVPEESLAGG